MKILAKEKCHFCYCNQTWSIWLLQCFQKPSATEVLKWAYVDERINILLHVYTCWRLCSRWLFMSQFNASFSTKLFKIGDFISPSNYFLFMIYSICELVYKSVWRTGAIFIKQLKKTTFTLATSMKLFMLMKNIVFHKHGKFPLSIIENKSEICIWNFHF